MPRVKENNPKLNGLTENTLNFYRELDAMFPGQVIVTSGKRTASQKIGKSSAHSHHNEGRAIDIKPNPDIYNKLMNTKEGLGLLNKYGVGIIDETDPEIMKKTGATGLHYHLGADSQAVMNVKNRFKTFQEKGMVEPLYSYNDKVKTNFTSVQEFRPPKVEMSIQHEHDFEEEVKVEIEKEKQVEENPEMQKLRQLSEQRVSFINSFQQLSQPVEYNQSQQSQIQLDPSVYQAAEVGQSIQQLPNLFSIG